MTVAAMLRGVNIGAHHRIKMEPLRDVYQGLGLRNVQTLVQSGNVVFETTARDLSKLADRLEVAFEAEFGFRPTTFLRTGPELRAVLDANPFAARTDLDPAKLIVFFLREPLDPAALARLAALDVIEEIRPAGRELYLYYPDGMGQSKLKAAILDRALGKVPTTARNMNTLAKLALLAGV